MYIASIKKKIFSPEGSEEHGGFKDINSKVSIAQGHLLFVYYGCEGLELNTLFCWTLCWPCSCLWNWSCLPGVSHPVVCHCDQCSPNAHNNPVQKCQLCCSSVFIFHIHSTKSHLVNIWLRDGKMLIVGARPADCLKSTSLHVVYVPQLRCSLLGGSHWTLFGTVMLFWGTVRLRKREHCSAQRKWAFSSESLAGVLEKI